MVEYSNTSPWYRTPIRQSFLDLYEKRDIPADASDILYTIQPQYNYRPDLLAFDLYDSPKLWWVFAVRNMDILKDPIFDFIPGTQIYLPKKSLITSIIGI